MSMISRGEEIGADEVGGREAEEVKNGRSLTGLGQRLSLGERDASGRRCG